MELITGRPLHVITRLFCNEMGLLQDGITCNYKLQALQDDPVITCNRGFVIGPLGMSASAIEDSAPYIDRENIYSSGTAERR